MWLTIIPGLLILFLSVFDILFESKTHRKITKWSFTKVILIIISSLIILIAKYENWNTDRRNSINIAALRYPINHLSLTDLIFYRLSIILK